MLFNSSDRNDANREIFHSSFQVKFAALDVNPATEEEMLTVVQVAGEGGMGEDDVVEVGVELECWKISSSV